MLVVTCIGLYNAYRDSLHQSAKEESPIQVSNEGFGPPNHCYSNFALKNKQNLDGLSFDQLDHVVDLERGDRIWGVGNFSATFSARENATFTVTDIKLVDVGKAEREKFTEFADVDLSGCGDATGGSIARAEFNLDISQKARRVIQSSVGSPTSSRSVGMDPIDVTSSNNLTVEVPVQSCKEPRKFSVEVSYLEKSTSKPKVQKFGPFILAAPDFSKPLYKYDVKSQSIVQSEWGDANKSCGGSMNSIS